MLPVWLILYEGRKLFLISKEKCKLCLSENVVLWLTARPKTEERRRHLMNTSTMFALHYEAI